MADVYSIGTPDIAAATAGSDGTVIALLKLLTNQMAAGGVGNQIEGQVADGVAPTGVLPVLMGGQDGTLLQSMLVDTTGRPLIAGAVADGTANTGINPIYVATRRVTGNAITSWPAEVPAETQTNTLVAPFVNSYKSGFNAVSWDRWRNNTEVNSITRAANTTGGAGSDIINYNARGLIAFLSVTVNPGAAETLNLLVQVKDEAGDDVYTTIASTGVLAVFGPAAGATGTELLVLDRGIAETQAVVGLQIQNLPIGKTFRFNVTHSSTGAWTYKVSYVLLV